MFWQLKNAPIAQLDRASGYGPEGREFESSSARQKEKSHIVWLFLFVFFSVLFSLFNLL